MILSESEVSQIERQLTVIANLSKPSRVSETPRMDLISAVATSALEDLGRFRESRIQKLEVS